MVVDERTVNMYRGMSQEQFTALAALLFDYYMTDEINVKLRRMLTKEQYRNEILQFCSARFPITTVCSYRLGLLKVYGQGSLLRQTPIFSLWNFSHPYYDIL
jgi:hypothetical protein